MSVAWKQIFKIHKNQYLYVLHNKLHYKIKNPTKNWAKQMKMPIQKVIHMPISPQKIWENAHFQ